MTPLLAQIPRIERIESRVELARWSAAMRARRRGPGRRRALRGRLEVSARGARAGHRRDCDGRCGVSRFVLCLLVSSGWSRLVNYVIAGSTRTRSSYPTPLQACRSAILIATGGCGADQKMGRRADGGGVGRATLEESRARARRSRALRACPRETKSKCFRSVTKSATVTAIRDDLRALHGRRTHSNPMARRRMLRRDPRGHRSIGRIARRGDRVLSDGGFNRGEPPDVVLASTAAAGYPLVRRGRGRSRGAD